MFTRPPQTSRINWGTIHHCTPLNSLGLLTDQWGYSQSTGDITAATQESLQSIDKDSPMTKSSLYHVLLCPPRGHLQLGQNCISLVGIGSCVLQWGSHNHFYSTYEGRSVASKLSCGDLLQTGSAEFMKMVAVWPREQSYITPSVHLVLNFCLQVHPFLLFFPMGSFL